MELIQVSVILPAFNEDPEQLEKFIESIINSLSGTHSLELILINDGSCDKYSRSYEQLENNYPALHIIRHNKNEGQIKAVNTGLRNVRGEYVICIDADGEYSSDAVVDILEALKSGKNFVSGVRRVRNNYPFIKKTGSLIINRLFSLLNPMSNCEDFLCPVNGITKQLLESLTLDGFKYRHFKLDLLLHTNVLANIPVSYNHNSNESNYSIFQGVVFFISILYEVLHFSLIRKTLTGNSH